jgi:hypothetical protein
VTILELENMLDVTAPRATDYGVHAGKTAMKC